MASIVARFGPFEPRTTAISILCRPGERIRWSQRTRINSHHSAPTPGKCKSVRTYTQDAARRKASMRASLRGSGRSGISFPERPLVPWEVNVDSRRRVSSTSPTDVEDALQEGQTYDEEGGAQSRVNAREERTIRLMQQWETYVPYGGDPNVVVEDAPEHAITQQAQAAYDALRSRTAVSAQDSWGRKWRIQIDASADYKIELSQALIEEEPDRLLRAFVAASEDTEYITSIPDTAFSRILHMIRPDTILLPLARIHNNVSAAYLKLMGIMPIESVIEEYLHIVLDVVTVRKETGKRLNIGDYTMLLNCARQTGSWAVAKSLWNAMSTDGITPNTPCYNHYMASMVRSGVHGVRERHRIRVTPFNMRARSMKVLGPGFKNYRAGDRGIKSTVMRIFTEMLSNEAIADLDTFEVVISGAAREGDLATVKSILKKVWGIDVDGIMSGNDKSAPTQLRQSSPLHPTSGLLCTIAETFSINNDIPAALRLVDYVSRHYSVPITDRVWEILIEWTYVLSKRRVKHQDPLHRGNLLGQLPKQSLKDLWDTMIGAPYHVSPSVTMYNFLIVNLARRGRLPDVWHYMEEARQLYEQARQANGSAWLELCAALDQQSPRQPGDASIEELQRNWDQAEFTSKRDSWFMKRWLRLLLRTLEGWNRTEEDMEWSTRMIPRILSKWAPFAPTTVRYETVGGEVVFLFRTEQEIEDAHKYSDLKKQERARVLQRRPRFLGQNWIHGEHVAQASEQATEGMSADQ